MVHFPGLARTRLCIQRAVSRVHRDGFPHSEIPGSKPACGSPGLIAASHVLLRLLAPRHPPYALSSLTIKLTLHVVPAHLVVSGALCFVRINSPFHLCSISSRTYGFNAAHLLPPHGGRIASRYCQLIQLSKSFGSRRSAPRLAERSKKLEPK
jgi:hypothetical protein